MAVRPQRERARGEQSRAADRGDDERRLSPLRQGVVALHLGQRTVPRHLFRFSGAVIVPSTRRTLIRLTLRSVAKQRVSKGGAASCFETRPIVEDARKRAGGALLSMRPMKSVD